MLAIGGLLHEAWTFVRCVKDDVPADVDFGEPRIVDIDEGWILTAIGSHDVALFELLRPEYQIRRLLILRSGAVELTIWSEAIELLRTVRL